MDIIKDILDDIINYSLFFYHDEIIEEHLIKYINYLEKKINNNFCESYFEKIFSIVIIKEVMSIKDYLNKLIKGLEITNSIMISAIIYLERLEIDLNIYNIHKLLLISLILSSKFLEDLYYKNKCWAKYVGMSLTRLNRLEILYLVKIKNNLFIYNYEFFDKFNQIFNKN